MSVSTAIEENKDLYLCRSCNNPLDLLIVSLGKTPLANALLKKEQLTSKEPFYPLDLYFCPKCSLVQISHTVSPVTLFEDYLYLSSYSDTMLKSSKEIAERLIQRQNLNSNSLVIEIASNDGYLLQNYKSNNVPVLGIEPAKNIAKIAIERGIPTKSNFFSAELAKEMKKNNVLADIIHANNVLAHVPDLKGFVEGLKILLKPTGTIVIEVPYVVDMIKNTEFDTIYHEHLCYFSVTALNNLFNNAGLSISDIEHLSIHGGSLRLFITHNFVNNSKVKELIEKEKKEGVTTFSHYSTFSNQIKNIKTDLLSLLNDLKAKGKSIAAYGASAKGTTLLNFFGINKDTIDFVVDRSKIKQNYYTPGTHLPILPPEEILKKMPDYLLLLTWNFADEILKQQDEYRTKGGKFIIPIPKVQIK